MAARRYDASSFWDRRYHLKRFERVKALLESCVRAGDDFCDVGCGTGEYLALARNLGADEVVGLDISHAYCRRSAAQGGMVVVGDGSILPFAADSFDVVLCSEVVEHVPDERANALADELARVSRRHIVITTPNAAAAIRRTGRRLAPRLVEAYDGDVGHLNLLDEDALAALFLRDGLVSDLAKSWHITPPVVGEILHLPPATDPLTTRVEGFLDRRAARSGNILGMVVRRCR